MTSRWTCTACGTILADETPPENCPVCATDAAQFTRLPSAKNSSPETTDRLDATSGSTWPQLIVAQAPDAILAADTNGIIRLWNRGAERIFGVAAGEALGQSLDLIIPENLRQRHWQGWGNVMQTGTSRYGEDQLLRVPALRGDGSRLSSEFSIIMLKDEQGTMTGVAAILRDVTTQWEREKRLQQQLNTCREQGFPPTE